MATVKGPPQVLITMGKPGEGWVIAVVAAEDNESGVARGRKCNSEDQRFAMVGLGNSFWQGTNKLTVT